MVHQYLKISPLQQRFHDVGAHVICSGEHRANKVHHDAITPYVMANSDQH